MGRQQKEAEKLRRAEEKRRKEEEVRLEKLRKEEERQRKEAEKEADKLRKEEEKRRKEEEKRKKDEKLQEEKLKKEEERLKREAEKQKKDEEKRKREEEKENERLRKKLKQDEEEKKKTKQQKFMERFIVHKTPPASPAQPTAKSGSSLFKDFQIKTGMTIAPSHRRSVVERQAINKGVLLSSNPSDEQYVPYLVEIKKRGARKCSRTVQKPVESEVVIIDPKLVIDNPTEAGLIKWRWKLMQFHNNMRPPYWGTWKRQPIRVTGRRPFAREEELDYEFDSDDEWEDEPEDGEDLGDKDDDDKEEDDIGGEGSEDEDDFLVPHGYLSDDEGGVPEYRDKDSLKCLEEQYMKDLRRENINGYPIIETSGLEKYRIIFCPAETFVIPIAKRQSKVDKSIGVEKDQQQQQRKDVDVRQRMPKTAKYKFLGQSWDKVDLSQLSLNDESDTERKHRQSKDKESTHHGKRLRHVSKELNRFPRNLKHLTGRYPMEEDVRVTTCLYCKRIMMVNHTERHVIECELIPAALKDELYVAAYGKKYKKGSLVHPMASASKSLLRPSHSTTHHSHRHQPPKSIPTSSITAPSTKSSSNTSGQVSINYQPTIKLQKADSVPTDSKKAISKKSLSKPTAKVSSVVLKIKGNTSTTTTTTSSGRITLHSPIPRLESLPSPAPPPIVLTTRIVPVPPPHTPVHEKVPPSLAVPTKASLKSVDSPIPSPPIAITIKIKKDPKKIPPRKVIPLRERRFNPDEHCGVINSDGIQCKRSLTCKTHSMGLRRAVPGRSQPFDTLIATQKEARDKAKQAKQDSTNSAPTSPAMIISPYAASMSSDNSSDASRLSVPVPTPPPPPPSVPQIFPPQIQIQAPRPAAVQPALSLTQPNVIHNIIKMNSPAPPVEKKKPKPNGLSRRTKETLTDFGIPLHRIKKQPEGFISIAQIIYPDNDGALNREGLIPFEIQPIVNGRNILLVDEVEKKLEYLSFPLVRIPVIRQKRDIDEPESEVKRARIENETITFSRAEPEPEFETSKVSFQLQPKKVCRPSRLDKKRWSEVTLHLGPLVEMTGTLNEPIELNVGFESFGKLHEGLLNPQNWALERLNHKVDAPVSDSELSKLLAAQFEDY